MCLTARSAFMTRYVFSLRVGRRFSGADISSSKTIYYRRRNILLIKKKIVNIYIAMAEGGFENPAFDPDESCWDEKKESL